MNQQEKPTIAGAPSVVIEFSLKRGQPALSKFHESVENIFTSSVFF